MKEMKSAVEMFVEKSLADKAVENKALSGSSGELAARRRRRRGRGRLLPRAPRRRRRRVDRGGDWRRAGSMSRAKAVDSVQKSMAKFQRMEHAVTSAGAAPLELVGDIVETFGTIREAMENIEGSTELPTIGCCVALANSQAPLLASEGRGLQFGMWIYKFLRYRVFGLITHVAMPIMQIFIYPFSFFVFFLLNYLFGFIQLISDVFIVVKSITENDILRVSKIINSVRDKILFFVQGFNLSLQGIKIPGLPSFSLYIPGLQSAFDATYRAFAKIARIISVVFNFGLGFKGFDCDGAKAPVKLSLNVVLLIFLVIVFDLKLFPMVKITFRGLGKTVKTVLENVRLPRSRPIGGQTDFTAKLKLFTGKGHESQVLSKPGLEFSNTVSKGVPLPREAANRIKDATSKDRPDQGAAQGLRGDLRQP